MAKVIAKVHPNALSTDLFSKVSAIIDEGRKYVSTAVDLAEVYSKYQIGMYIVEEEQSGEKRAGYGKQILINLSKKLTEKYGDGWSVEQLTLIRKFYMTYSKFVNTDYEIQNSDLGIAEHTAAKIVIRNNHSLLRCWLWLFALPKTTKIVPKRRNFTFFCQNIWIVTKK